jgi:hypothetical protein
MPGSQNGLGTDRLDVVDLRQAPLWFRAQVIQTGVCIYAHTSRDRTRWGAGVRMQEREGPSRCPAHAKGREEGRRGAEALVAVRAKGPFNPCSYCWHRSLAHHCCLTGGAVQ